MPKNYLCIQRSPTGGKPSGPSPSPAEMDQMYAAFNEWRETFRDNIINLGGRLLGDAKVIRHDGEVDGPFVEPKEVIGGYMILSAETIDEAANVAKLCPGVLRPGSSVEVREVMVP